MECIINNPTSCEGSSSSSKHSNNKSNKEKNGVRKSSTKGGGGVRLSTDPQSVAARERRHRISDRFKILQSMVPGGSKMDTVSMLEGAIHYVKFLKTQIWLHQALIDFVDVDHESPLFLPAEYNFPDEGTISLQQNPSSSVSVHSHHQQSLPQLPLAQCCFQGEEDYNTFDATMKYWPA